ncbi:transposase, partial [Patescibacteria group bacterium]|nr:transposase [Patescibacteria group bacterium]
HNCFVERSHRTDEEEFYRLLDLPSLDNQKLLLEMQKWQHRYNFLRLHSSCGNMPPFKYYLTVLQTGA